MNGSKYGKRLVPKEIGEIWVKPNKTSFPDLYYTLYKQKYVDTASN
jgi:hypothetical protein